MNGEIKPRDRANADLIAQLAYDASEETRERLRREIAAALAAERFATEVVYAGVTQAIVRHATCGPTPTA